MKWGVERGVTKHEGEVVEVAAQGFSALIRFEENERFLFEFELEEVRPDQLHLVREGAKFVWFRGLEVSESGSKRRVSYLEFE